MIELRKSPRIQVAWRAGVKLPDGKLMLAKVVNLSAEGVLMLCSEHLELHSSYPMLMEIPGIYGGQDIHKVHCKGTIRHVILSGDSYRTGIQLSEMSGLHNELVQAWLSKTSKY